MRGKSPDVAVIGAGVFGGWAAFHLLRLGARVALIDAWPPGHSRGSSSDHSRILRCGYGAHALYTDWAWRARKLWLRYEREWKTPLFIPCGVLWLAPEETEYVKASLAAMSRWNIPVQKIPQKALAKATPQMSVEDVRFAYFEIRAGVLRARTAVETVARAVAGHPRGSLQIAHAIAPVGARHGVPEPDARARHAVPLQHVLLADGTKLAAGNFVFVCGPWLPQMFPTLLGERIRVTKQEVFYFGPPAGDARFNAPRLPAWIEIGASFYGIPSFGGYGLKVADDTSTTLFEPTHGERAAAPERLASARAYLARRFPALADAPLSEARVCQYERTPDSHLVIDRHPSFSNVWLAGGGSGHGFKLGPAVGEFVAHLVLDRESPSLGLARPRGVRDLREAIPAELRLGAARFTDASDISRLRSI
ncbi:MAG TPA: FAD-dependent oxidoreductase [Candidatus Nitrosotenuis sp.]|nr:FAD-dependent oxidoreductase [Candidatus Nitrosotenuis sp.]